LRQYLFTYQTFKKRFKLEKVDSSTPWKHLVHYIGHILTFRDFAVLFTTSNQLFVSHGCGT